MSTCHQIRFLGVVVLLVGLVSAVLIYRSGEVLSTQPDRRASHTAYEDRDFNLSLEDSKKATREMEIYYGKLGLVFVKGSGWLEKLKQPKPMAVSIAILSTLAASGCFVAANRWPRP